ncbi:MAG: hypothetical protein IPL32_08740 [Chloracidobacterium sp.]|nr:hypothetical protein [Chloracidobacterium sp.]
MRKITGLIIVIAFLGLVKVVYPNVSFGLMEFITGIQRASLAVENAPLLPRVADKDKPGYPHVNYDDPLLSLPADAKSVYSPAVAGVTADFDFDGVQDLVSVDTSGKITFYKGNADTIYPNSPEAKLRRAESGEATAFSKAVPDRSLPISPDFISAGDFNADGKADILAAARGTNIIYCAAGDGNGRFLAPSAITVDGQITALETGEIGRPDQQADIAVAYVGKGSSFVAVYEHPEGAFARKPEKFALPTAARSLAIGNLDKDPYGDVAAAGGSSLTLIHGRGQAYPLDLKADLDIERPSAFLQSKQMPFSIVDLAIGRFGKERGESIALLSSDGRISLLEPRRSDVAVTTNKLTRDEIRQTGATSMRPVDADIGNYGMIKNDLPKTEAEADERGQLMADASAIKEDREKVFNDKFAALQKESAKLTPAERAKKLSDDIQKTLDTNARRKVAFEATLAPKPVPFSKFRIETVAADPAIAAAVSNGRPNQLIKGRFSDSGLDDLAIIDAVTNNIHIVGKWNSSQQMGRANTVSISAGAGSSAIVPMRLNADALSDIVVLGSSPIVMMSLPAATFTVNSTDADSGGDCVTPNQVCTLRRALFLANTNIGGTNLIVFDIPGSGVQTLHPSSNFTDINKQTTIDGTTQPGFAGSPLIEISGDLMAGGHEGLKIKASNSLVRGLAINQIPSYYDDDSGSQIGGSGITVLSTSSFPNVGNVIIEGNFLGTDPTGEIKKGNDANGVHIFDADNNTIGGTTAQARNILSGNGNPDENKQGVGLAITGGNNNFIYGNYIGTNSLGNIKVGNSYGVFFTGINNRFGGDGFGEGNVVSGNGGPENTFGQCQGGGIYMFGLISLEDGSLQTDSNVLKGNKIGTTANGVGPLGNCGVGVSSPADVNTTIGSIAHNGRNVISDNGWDALYCGYASQSTFGLSGACYIIGNNIGTDITGTTAMRNDQRNNSCVGFCLITDTVWTTPSDLAFVIVGSPGGTSPSGDCTGMCNLISGNNDPGGFGGGGLYRSGYGFVFAVNNYLGVNRSGTAALPNRQGFNSYYGSYVFGAELSDGNGGTVDGGNIASGNDQSGASTTHIAGGGTFEIRGNIVGLSSDGNTSIGNGVGGTVSCGVCSRSFGGTSAAIGGTGNLQRNYIAAETSDPYYNGTRGTGLSISTFAGASVTVFNNFIGLNKSGNLAGNSGHGIEASGDGRTTIGGYNPGEMNFIIGNGRGGVVVSQFTHPQTGISPARNVTISKNAIAINGGLGIDLVNATLSDPYPSGVTTNDCFDVDDGANGYQNFPELFEAVINGNGTVSIPTTLRSVPASQFTIDYYQSPAADPSTYGEGSNYIGSVNVQTDGNGFAGFTFVSANPVIPTQLAFTATATDLFGNTSEFSCAAGVCTTGTFQQALESPEVTCIEPIVVTIDSDESDPNTADGFCDVDTSNTGLQCSLRAAIQEANARNGFDVINFDIPGGGVRTIQPMTALPTITERVMVNGTSQPGYLDSPLIEIRDGNNSGNGIAIQTNNVTINGLAIHRFVGADILIQGSDNVVESCFLGIFPDGMTADNTRQAISAIAISGSSSQRNRIGGAVSENGNVIGNSEAGIFLQGGANANTVINNKIGTNKIGTGSLPNGIGIAIAASNGNTIGGILDEDTNLISGNTTAGIDITAGSNTNRIEGNMIGTDTTGNAPLKNGFAGLVILSSAANNTIGGSNDRRNIISGNAPNNGIVIGNGAGQNTISGNYIGINKAGTAALPNKWGVALLDTSNAVGSSTGPPNIVSGNELGVVLSGESAPLSSANVINNRIGTDPSGNNAIPNRQGVVLLENVTNASISQNLISGNTEQGILTGGITVGPSNVSISDNKIGTKQNGTDPLPNRDGVILFSGTNNSTVSGNTISGNTYSGLQLGGGGVGSQLALDLAHILGREELTKTLPIENNTVTGNRIGTTSSGSFGLGNGKTGVFLAVDAFNNQIGGKRSAFEGNVISGNDQTPGIGIAIGTLIFGGDFDVEDHPTGNKIQGNRIGIKSSGYAAVSNNIGIKIKLGNNNLIGGDTKNCIPDNGCEIDDYANIIGGNTQQGIWLEGAFAANNSIVSNYIGVAPDGTAIGNGADGIFVNQALNTTILNNTIGNSGANGILVDGNAPAFNEIGQQPVKRELGTPLTRISGNTIGIFKGLGFEFPVEAPNVLAGVALSNVQNVLVGTFQPGEPKNIISGNNGPGVLIEGPNSYSNQINNAIIGTDSAGTLGIGNGGDGVKIVNSSNNIIGQGSGGITIGGNVGNGVMLEGLGVQYNSLLSADIGVINHIGAAYLRVANGQNGVAIINAPNNTIGGANLTLGNKISGNTRSGIFVSGQGSVGNFIRRNLVGNSPVGSAFGNTLHGIHLAGGASNNIVGGDDPDAGNTIGGNGGSGIFVEDGEPAPRTEGTQSTQNNRFTRNIIFGNAGLGIDIFPVGVNPNDGGDGDSGPNRGQNYPEIDNFSIDGNGDLIVFYLVDTDPSNANYGANGIKIEFFISDATGQGRLPITSSEFWAISDYNNGGFKQINLGNAAQLGFQLGDSLTAAATDADGNTSEFVASGFVPTPTPSSTPTPEPVINGTITYGNAIDAPAVRFVSNALVHAAGTTISMTTATGGNGEYSLSGFDSGAYTITPSKAGGQNNAITSFDAALISQHMVGPPFPQLTGNQLSVADVSGNGNISSFDAAHIAHYVVASPPIGATGNWKFDPLSNFHVAVNSSIVGEDYTAFLMGEVSGNWLDGGARPAKESDGSITVRAQQMIASAKNEVVIPIRVEGAANKGIIAYEFDLRYDPFVIRPQTVPVDVAETVSSGLIAVSNSETPGLLRVAVYGPTPITGNGLLLNLRFTAVGTTGSVSQLVWERLIFNENIRPVSASGRIELKAIP